MSHSSHFSSSPPPTSLPPLSSGRSRHAFLDIITSSISNEDRKRIINAFAQKESLLDSDLLQAYVSGQPLLICLAVSILFLSFTLSILALTITSCRALGRCGGKRYQPHPTSRGRFLFLLLSFLVCWMLLASSSLHFIVASAAFWSQHSPTELISVPVRSSSDYPDYDSNKRIRRESILASLFNDPDYTGDFEQLQEEEELTTTTLVQKTTQEKIPLYRETLPSEESRHQLYSAENHFGMDSNGAADSLSAERSVQDQRNSFYRKLPILKIQPGGSKSALEESQEISHLTAGESETDIDSEEDSPRGFQLQSPTPLFSLESFAPTRLLLPESRRPSTPEPNWMSSLDKWRQEERERTFVDPQMSEVGVSQEDSVTLFYSSTTSPFREQYQTQSTHFHSVYSVRTQTPPPFIRTSTYATTGSLADNLLNEHFSFNGERTEHISEPVIGRQPETMAPVELFHSTEERMGRVLGPDYNRRPVTTPQMSQQTERPLADATAPLSLPPLLPPPTTRLTEQPLFTRVSPVIVARSTTIQPLTLAPFLQPPLEDTLDADVEVLGRIAPDAASESDYVSIASEDAIPIQVGVAESGKNKEQKGQPAVSLLSHRRRFVTLHSPGFRVLHRFFALFLGLILSFCTLPSLILVLIGAMYYARSYHPMDRSKVSDRVGVLCVLVALCLLFIGPVLLIYSDLGLLLSHAHHSVCPLVQPTAKTVEEIVMTMEGCTRVQSPVVRMWQSALLAALLAIPVALLLLQLSAYFLRMRTEHYWTRSETSQAHFM